MARGRQQLSGSGSAGSRPAAVCSAATQVAHSSADLGNASGGAQCHDAPVVVCWPPGHGTELHWFEPNEPPPLPPRPPCEPSQLPGFGRGLEPVLPAAFPILFRIGLHLSSRRAAYYAAPRKCCCSSLTSSGVPRSMRQCPPPAAQRQRDAVSHGVLPRSSLLMSRNVKSRLPT